MACPAILKYHSFETSLTLYNFQIFSKKHNLLSVSIENTRKHTHLLKIRKFMILNNCLFFSIRWVISSILTTGPVFTHELVFSAITKQCNYCNKITTTRSKVSSYDFITCLILPLYCRHKVNFILTGHFDAHIGILTYKSVFAKIKIKLKRKKKILFFLSETYCYSNVS